MFKELVTVSYRINVLTENFFTIMDKDGEAIVNDEKTLGDLLDALPYIDKVEYDGHFGPGIYIEIDVDRINGDTEENWKEIKKVITDYIGTKVV